MQSIVSDRNWDPKKVDQSRIVQSNDSPRSGAMPGKFFLSARRLTESRLKNRWRSGRTAEHCIASIPCTVPSTRSFNSIWHRTRFSHFLLNWLRMILKLKDLKPNVWAAFRCTVPPLPSQRALTIDPANPAKSTESTESSNASCSIFLSCCSVVQCDNLGSLVPIRKWWGPLKILKRMPDTPTNTQKIWKDFKGWYPSMHERDKNVARTCTICRLASWKRSSSSAAPAWEREEKNKINTDCCKNLSNYVKICHSLAINDQQMEERWCIASMVAPSWPFLQFLRTSFSNVLRATRTLGQQRA